MLWERYVLSGPSRRFTTDEVLSSLVGPDSRVLVITCVGFDPRARLSIDSLSRCFESITGGSPLCDLQLYECKGYLLDDGLKRATDDNRDLLRSQPLWNSQSYEQIKCTDSDGKRKTSQFARQALERHIDGLSEYTDIVIDISSMPRVIYLTFLFTILGALIPSKTSEALANAPNLLVVAAEDPGLDSRIRSLEVDRQVSTIRGFSGGLGGEAYQDWPIVWLPVLGENRAEQLRTVHKATTESPEICPVLPHPTADPRRGDKLLLEYRALFVDEFNIRPDNVLYADERNPFEAYRQIYQAMVRYQKSLSLLGGCRLWVTPLSSKLITVGAALACFEMHTTDADDGYVVGLPYAEPQRYEMDGPIEVGTEAHLDGILLSGQAYRRT